jgi:hypothetical protein
MNSKSYYSSTAPSNILFHQGLELILSYEKENSDVLKIIVYFTSLFEGLTKKVRGNEMMLYVK